MISTRVAIPAAMAEAACSTAGTPCHDDEIQTGDNLAWYAKSVANCPTSPSTSRMASPASAAGRPATVTKGSA